MKKLLSPLKDMLPTQTSRRNVRMFCWLLGATGGLWVVYGALFQLIMLYESRSYSWMTSFYWTVTNMSALGPGDVVFYTDLGRLFTVIVNMSGTVFLLIFIPLTFYHFFQSSSRVPRELPHEMQGHVVIVGNDAVTQSLIQRLLQHHYPYVQIESDLQTALLQFDMGMNVMLGSPDNRDTFRRARVDQAALVVTADNDAANTHNALHVRGVSSAVPLVSTAAKASSIEILQVAGATNVFQFTELLGRSLARKANAGDKITHVIGQYHDLQIAEATATGTPLVGKQVKDSKLREMVGVTVLGVWERGHFELATPETEIKSSTVLVLAGSREQLDLYNELFCIYYATVDPVLILGGGRVGRATADALDGMGIDYRIVERSPSRVVYPDKTIVGDAADLEVLKEAGIERSPSVIVTTHDDDANIYLTLYCRHLRPDIQIVSRTVLERSVETLHEAGADFVISYASLGATSIFNLLRRADILMVAEGLIVMRVSIPAALDGKTIADSSIRPKTGCSVVALYAEGDMQINPGPECVLREGAEFILIGTVEAEGRFIDEFGVG